MAGPREIHPKLDRLMKRLSRKLVAEVKRRSIQTRDVEGQTFFEFDLRRPISQRRSIRDRPRNPMLTGSAHT